MPLPSFLDGYKTYVFIGLIVANQVAEALGFTSGNTYEILNWVFGGGAAAAMRDAIAKSK